MEVMPRLTLNIDLEGMRHTVCTSLAARSKDIEAIINKQVEATCTEENITNIIQDKTNKVIKVVIEKEIENFYTFGAGRAVIAEAVRKQLTPKEDYTREVYKE